MKKSIRISLYALISALAISSVTIPLAVVFYNHNNVNNAAIENNQNPSDNDNGSIDNNQKPSIDEKPPVSDNSLGNELAQKMQSESYINGFIPNNSNPNLNWYSNRSVKNSDYMSTLENITFSMFFLNEVGSNDPSAVESLSGGTGWLLDYAYCQDENGNPYTKLFIGTNFHVARHLINKNDNIEYRQNDVIANGGYTKQFGLAWYENNKYVSLIYKNERLPKTIFMAQDFISDKNADEYVTSFLKEKDMFGKYNGYFADFAVIEWDFYENESINNSDDLSKPNKKLSISNKIKLVINAYDNFFNRLTNSKPNDYKNRSNSTIYTDLSYIDVSYYDQQVRPKFTALTKESEIDEIKHQQKTLDDKWTQQIFKYFSNYSLSPTNVYAFGYPWNNKSIGIPMGTVEKTDYDKEAGNFRLPKTYSHFYYSHLNWATLNGNNKSQVYWNGKPMFSYYGNLGKTIFPNNTQTPSYGGISGSLVINDEGLFAGVISSSIQKTTIIDNNNVYTEVGTLNFVPFTSSFPVGSDPTYLPVKAYNLIDGSNKVKYPDQTKSFKEELFKYYPNIKTKMFNFK